MATTPTMSSATAAARKIVDRAGDALGNRAVGFGLGQALDQFVADVAGVEVREDQARWPCRRPGCPAPCSCRLAGTMAASSCSSPSRLSSGAFSLARRVASMTLSISALLGAAVGRVGQHGHDRGRRRSAGGRIWRRTWRFRRARRQSGFSTRPLSANRKVPLAP